jgi:hypothetical protein
MAACAARLGGAHPEGGLDAFVAEVAEHELVGVHDMFTRKVVVDMLRRELGPEPEPEIEPEPEPEVAEGAPAEPPTETHIEAPLDVVVDGEGDEATDEADPAPAAHEAAEEEVPSEDPPGGPSEVALEALPEVVEGEQGEEGEEGSVAAEVPGLEEAASLEASEVAQLELGAIDALDEPGGGLELDAMAELGEGVQVPDGESLSAWEEESWSMAEVEVDASLGAVDELARGSDALDALPSWGEHTSGVGEAGTPPWGASLGELGEMSAAGFEAVEGVEIGGARVVADEVEGEAFEAVEAGAREAFVAARAAGEPAAFEVEPGLKVLPRGHALRDCLDRVPAGWLDVIARKVEVDEPRRADRARRIAEELARVEVLSELVESELSASARALGRALGASESARPTRWFVDGRHADPEDEAYFTFSHEGALGELRRCGLAFVGVSGAQAELEVVVPVGVRRALQLVLR